MLVHDLLVGFIVLGATEAIVKPVAAYFFKQQTKRWLPVLLDKLDSILPDALAKMSEDELRAYLISQYQMVTGETVSESKENRILKTIEREFSPLVSVRKNNDPRN